MGGLKQSVQTIMKRLCLENKCADNEDTMVLKKGYDPAGEVIEKIGNKHFLKGQMKFK